VYGGFWVVLRVDPISKELDKDTISILDHLRWTQIKGPNSAEAVTKLDNVLIDITVQAASDTQTCGLRVLQYHAIIGKTSAQSPGVLKEGGDLLQQFIVEVVLPQLYQVNLATMTQYYEAIRAKLHPPNWSVPLQTHPTWPEV
jgi:hypothetical protein